VHRANPDAQSTEDYYIITLFNEFPSHVINELQQKFLDSPACGLGLMHLLPSQCVGDTHSSEDFVAAVIPESLLKQ